MSIEKILDELTEHDPSLADNRETLRNTVQAMLDERPDSSPDEAFRISLRARLAEKAPKRRRFSALGISVTASAAAAVFAVILVGRSAMFRRVPAENLSYSKPTSEQPAQGYEPDAASETPDRPGADNPGADNPGAPVAAPVEARAPIEAASRDKAVDDLVSGASTGQAAQAQAKDTNRRYEEEIPGEVLKKSGLTAGKSSPSSPVATSVRGAMEGELMSDFYEVADQAYGRNDNSGEGYEYIRDNAFLSPLSDPFSTFSADVDTASYSNVRRYLNSGNLPPADAVRIEELVNYFPYAYPTPADGLPFKTTTGLFAAPWAPDHLLLTIGIRTREVAVEALPPSNLVLLLDVSGSMDEPDKLPLLKRSMELLVDRMRKDDLISIVVYAGAAGVVLPPTSGDEKALILESLDRLNAGGSTAGGEGLELAYRLAEKNFRKDGNNRIILATDGDFNVGMSSDGELVRYVEKKRTKGIFLSVLGFGTGNYQDGMMEQLSNNGNGNFAYIDSISEAKKVLVNEMGATLHTVASDVKFQVEFNPAQVESYRLIGYENRMMAARDFDDDTRDAGEIGAGHAVTALYEIVPADGSFAGRTPRYLHTDSTDSGELGMLRLRWKNPGSSKSELSEITLETDLLSGTGLTEDRRFAASVAEWGMILRDSPYKGAADINRLISEVKTLLGNDSEGYRAEFLSLLYKTRELMK